MRQLLPLFLREQRSANLPADVMAIFTRRSDLKTLAQQGLLNVRVKHGVRCFDGIDIGGSEESGNRVGEKVFLDPGFAVWVSDIIMANVCASRFIWSRCRVNGEKTDGPTLVLEDIKRGRWFAIGFLDIKKVGGGHCLLGCAFEVGTIDPDLTFRHGTVAYLVSTHQSKYTMIGQAITAKAGTGASRARMPPKDWELGHQSMNSTNAYDNTAHTATVRG